MGPSEAGGNVEDFLWAPDSSRIAYVADQDTNDKDELYTSLPDGSNNVKVSGTLVPSGDVMDFLWAPNSSRIAYRADQDTNNRNELYNSQPDGSNNVKVNGAIGTGEGLSKFLRLCLGTRQFQDLPILPTKVRRILTNYTLPFQRDRPVM